MRMFGKKSYATLFYWLFLIMSVLLIILALYRMINILSGETLEYSEDGKYILYKYEDSFIKTSLEDHVKIRRKGVFNIFYLSFYFLISSIIFKNVRVETIFSMKVINILRVFAIINFLPFFHSLIYNITTWGESWVFFDAFYTNLVYIVIGFFSLFIAAVFKQGLRVQQENDLTI